jgi:serine/threonine-protein kinase
MTPEPTAQADSQARHAEQLAGRQGVPLPQETTPTLSLSEAARTAPYARAPEDTGQPPAPAPLVIAGRYEFGPEIAHGGMGAVYRATDRILGREVAVKLVREDLVGTELAARFAAEARITGQLQHPGIPPVHDLGLTSEGCPFLAMKLFRGQTLAADLATRVAQLTRAACDPVDDPFNYGLELSDLRALQAERDEDLAEELRRLARVFEQICQAVAYAHSQGVIHRDLKPANIMVAAFGEIQVMDWGLAKRLRQPATATTGQPEAPRGSEPNATDGSAVGEANLTSPGAVMGTFAYMPPEQARGETEAVDARADVFALGAILCEVLTGRPPYLGRTSQEVWRQAAAGDLAAAMAPLRDCASSPDYLEASLGILAIRCLSPNRVERPAHAGEVAVAVNAALTGAAEAHRQAELELVRTDTQMGYSKKDYKKSGPFAVEFRALRWCVLFAMLWLFGYIYRAATVEEAAWTAKKEEHLNALEKALEEANKRAQMRVEADRKQRELWLRPDR